jgi:hypothetical protein
MKTKLFFSLVLVMFVTIVNLSFAAPKVEKKAKTECATDEKESKIKELDNFHKYMAKFYHKDYPHFKLNEMKKDITGMEKVAKSMEKMKLPEKYQSKDTQFKSTLQDLTTSIADLKTYVNTTKNLKKDDATLKAKVEKLHSTFHTLSEIFN